MSQSLREHAEQLIKTAKSITIFEDGCSFTGWSLITHKDGTALPASPYEVALYHRAVQAEKAQDILFDKIKSLEEKLNGKNTVS